MIKNSLASISDVAIYPIISLTIFVTFFVLLGYMVFRADKKYIKHMEEMPLSDESYQNN
ncbi:MAG TPA: hypothetical protein VK175_00145 [Leadbetterella sp.]|nr:hypothetical protein [Leadbetterella sp.]